MRTAASVSEHTQWNCYRQVRCVICGDHHRTSECPRRGKLKILATCVHRKLANLVTEHVPTSFDTKKVSVLRTPTTSKEGPSSMVPRRKLRCLGQSSSICHPRGDEENRLSKEAPTSPA